MKKADLILIITILIFAAFLFLPEKSNDDQLVATIYVGGEVFSQTKLSTLKKPKQIKVGECEILLEKDGVRFLTSTCSDQLCVNHARLSKSSDVMACVPNKVVVKLTQSDNDYDVVAY